MKKPKDDFLSTEVQSLRYSSTETINDARVASRMRIMRENKDYRVARENMVASQLKARGINDPLVLKAMVTVPRHLFVDEALESQAYNDHPLPIGEKADHFAALHGRLHDGSIGAQFRGYRDGNRNRLWIPDRDSR